MSRGRGPDSVWDGAERGRGIKSIAPPPSAGIMADSNSCVSSAPDLSTARRRGDRASRGAISRLSRHVGQLIGRIIVAEERFESGDIRRNSDNGQPRAGLH